MSGSKHAHAKKNRSVGNVSKIVAPRQAEPADEMLPVRAVATIDIDEQDIVIPGDKLEAESPVLAPEEDELAVSDEAGLDEEEVNPFEDKWEV